MSARFLALFAAGALSLLGADIPLPSRPASALAGGEFVRQIATLKLPEREREILRQVELGNVPEHWRRFVEVKFTRKIGEETFSVALSVSPDYLAIGSDKDYFLAPISPATAQAIADKIGCILPTRRIVDDIYNAATVKLTPAPIPPSAAITTPAVFQEHNEAIRQQRASSLAAHPLALVAGHKKDIVLTPQLAAAPGKVAIYGWHQPSGKPIQPLYLGHGTNWVDYSHGARFIRREIKINGTATTIEKVLADPKLCALLSDEGPLTQARYIAVAVPPKSKTADAHTFSNRADEQWTTLNFDPGVRVVIHSPKTFDAQKPVRLILYALPNGNTIEQTIGRKTGPADDWHFNIQHIGAQTRWLREHTSDANLIVAYLECAERSWPAWRRKNDPDGGRIGGIVQKLREHYQGKSLKLVLTGHSGGGSFIFGYINSAERIPEDIERISFLDSNYAYDDAQGHSEKLARWLADSKDRHLCVIAYHDSVALLNGKTFVSASGGTWGRSLAMRSDLEMKFRFVHSKTDDWQRSTALDGRVKFFLKENPTKAIFHTRLVELNGFIHALLTGTELEDKGYEFFGQRAYEKWIDAPP